MNVHLSPLLYIKKTSTKVEVNKYEYQDGNKRNSAVRETKQFPALRAEKDKENEVELISPDP
ncbi:hypothetical protein B1222_20485 [Paenibacillus larvae subsp. pulvifaciens]|nr:hypothetical protein B1222_20485 [Paenibacillus larvae subsp. pulvifaciens]AQZ47893.1 hypothetical protein B5S25_16165 [Paenibacillus larvae subsp. pulvifaciens]MBH0341979.1 hypothetical protein [Paenibacillus larvae]